MLDAKLPSNPLEEIEKNLLKVTESIDYLKKENEALLKASTELRKVVSSATNHLYHTTNELLNNKRSSNNTLINKLVEEKTSKEQSLAKLVTLFDQLSAINSQQPIEDKTEDGLPIMDIREELDEEGNVINATVQPQMENVGGEIKGEEKSNVEPMTESKTTPQTETKTENPKDVMNNQNEEGLPFMNIREEIDEDGNLVTSSVSPQVGGDGIETKLEKGSVEENQILELFEDMGILDKKDDLPSLSLPLVENAKELSDFEKNLKAKLAGKKKLKSDLKPDPQTKPVEASVKDPEPKPQVESTPEDEVRPAIPHEEILQLELIADDIEDSTENSEYVYADDEEWDFEDEDEEEGDDYDDIDFEPSNNEVTNMLMNQIHSLRSQNKPKVEELDVPSTSTATASLNTKKSILKNKNSTKKKKSVKFNAELEQVKQIENVSEDLKSIDNSRLKKSLFKQSRNSSSEQSESNSNMISDISSTTEVEEEQIVSETIKERVVVEDPQEMPVVTPSRKKSNFMKQREAQQLYPGLLTPVEKELPTPSKPVSRFKKQLDQKKSPAVTEQVVTPKPASKFKSNLQSLNYKPKALKGSKVLIPSSKPDWEPVDVVEEKETGNEVEKETETSQSADAAELDVRQTSLDYQSLLDDVDSMAKAYVLGLYDDDISTEGEVVDKLEDFEKINRIIEAREAQERKALKKAKGSKDSNNENKTSKTKGGDNFDPELDETSYNEDGLDNVEDELDNIEESDRAEILVDQIVEREFTQMEEEKDEEIEEIDAINAPNYLYEGDDLSMTPDVLEQQIVSQYHSLRTKLILGQNNFKKTEEEEEFQPIDEEGNPIRISRFKAAKLVLRKNV